ncbi:CYTH domain-containing protein [Ensifer sp. IC3342]|nr:CYTH domain-containing protein [Ensifer sp. BRP08]MCA1450473.1 CYTH domain-containing protein [Ensifer sp. IC3342]
MGAGEARPIAAHPAIGKRTHADGPSRRWCRGRTREEWEQPVASDTPVLDDPQLRALLAGTELKLAPSFEVHVKRHRWNVSEGDAALEVALDVGKVVAADRQAPFCEIEFEIKAGPLTALFALARKADLNTPVRLGVLSKAERGYRLLGPAPSRRIRRLLHPT